MGSPKKREKKPDFSLWDKLRGRIVSRKGGWSIGEAVHDHGFCLLEDLAGKASYFQVLVLHATGRLPDRRLGDWFEALFLCLSWPDARIWCNQAGSLAGTLRASPLAGVSAGILASDSRMYGPGTQHAGVAFITRALQERQRGLSAEEIVEIHPRRNPTSPPTIPGYARPVASGDERIPVMERVAAALGFTQGPHLDLAYDIERVMMDKYHEGMNLLGYCSAFLCDEGFTADEQYRIVSPMVQSGVLACYAEAADNPPLSFFPLRCEDIDYQGTEPREVPWSTHR